MSHTPSFQKAAEMLLGHTGLSSESRDAALLPRGSAGHHSHCRDCVGHCAAGHPGIRDLGSPRAVGGCWAHFPGRCLHLAGVQANRMNPPSVPFIMEMSRSKATLFLLDTGLCSGVQSE